MILGLTFVLAFCSMLYELLLAQSLAAVLGNTVLRYNLTIGIYIASLGLGSLVYDRIRNKDNSAKDSISKFVSLEVVLGVFGASFPVLVLLLESVLSGTGFSFLVSLVAHLMIIVIGFLSGLELPLLMDLSQGGGKKVLASDYIGSLFAAVLFPLVLLPEFGLFFTAFLVGTLNLFCAAGVAFSYRERKWAPVFIVFLLGMICLYFSETIADFVINGFYMRGVA